MSCSDLASGLLADCSAAQQCHILHRDMLNAFPFGHICEPRSASTLLRPPHYANAHNINTVHAIRSNIPRSKTTANKDIEIHTCPYVYIFSYTSIWPLGRMASMMVSRSTSGCRQVLHFLWTSFDCWGSDVARRC